MPKGGKQPGAGRPLKYGVVLKKRSYRLSDDEDLKVKEFIKQLRSEKNDN
jgi:hypothetical protein